VEHSIRSKSRQAGDNFSNSGCS